MTLVLLTLNDIEISFFLSPCYNPACITLCREKKLKDLSINHTVRKSLSTNLLLKLVGSVKKIDFIRGFAIFIIRFNLNMKQIILNHRECLF